MSSKITLALFIALGFASVSTAGSAAVGAPWPPPPGTRQAAAPGYGYSAIKGMHRPARLGPQQGEAHGSR